MTEWNYRTKCHAVLKSAKPVLDIFDRLKTGLRIQQSFSFHAWSGLVRRYQIEFNASSCPLPPFLADNTLRWHASNFGKVSLNISNPTLCFLPLCCSFNIYNHISLKLFV